MTDSTQYVFIVDCHQLIVFIIITLYNINNHSY